MSRQDVVADAAIAVLAAGGARSLTHRAVDTAAGLPAGSTSNVFRSRGALVAGVLARLSAVERAAFEQVPPGVGGSAVLDRESLTAAVAAMIDNALGPGRAGTLARQAIFQEAAADPASAAALRAATEQWWSLTERLLRRAGGIAPRRRARWLLAYVDGVIRDQLARPTRRFDATAAIAPAVYGALQMPDGAG